MSKSVCVPWKFPGWPPCGKAGDANVGCPPKPGCAPNPKAGSKSIILRFNKIQKFMSISILLGKGWNPKPGCAPKAGCCPNPCWGKPPCCGNPNPGAANGKAPNPNGGTPPCGIPPCGCPPWWGWGPCCPTLSWL